MKNVQCGITPKIAEKRSGMTTIDEMAEAMQKYRDSRGEPLAYGNCHGLAQAAWEVVQKRMLSDDVRKVAHLAFQFHHQISDNVGESVGAALTATLKKMEE